LESRRGPQQGLDTTFRRTWDNAISLLRQAKFPENVRAYFLGALHAFGEFAFALLTYVYDGKNQRRVHVVVVDLLAVASGRRGPGLHLGRDLGQDLQRSAKHRRKQKQVGYIAISRGQVPGLHVVFQLLKAVRELRHRGLQLGPFWAWH
jgi:hypothetical protein